MSNKQFSLNDFMGLEALDPKVESLAFYRIHKDAKANISEIDDQKFLKTLWDMKMCFQKMALSASKSGDYALNRGVYNDVSRVRGALTTQYEGMERMHKYIQNGLKDGKSLINVLEDLPAHHFPPQKFIPVGGADYKLQNPAVAISNYPVGRRSQKIEHALDVFHQNFKETDDKLGQLMPRIKDAVELEKKRLEEAERVKARSVTAEQIRAAKIAAEKFKASNPVTKPAEEQIDPANKKSLQDFAARKAQELKAKENEAKDISKPATTFTEKMIGIYNIFQKGNIPEEPVKRSTGLQMSPSKSSLNVPEGEAAKMGIAKAYKVGQML